MAPSSPLERHSLRDHPEFGALLEKIAVDLAPTQPPGSSRAHFYAGRQRHDFLLDAGTFSVVDAGRAVTTIGCVVCSVNSRRQYGFYVQCLDGITRGPIGSACIFEHVLGAARARGYGVRLRGLVAELTHYRQHRAWLQEAHEDYDGYLRRASLTYLTDQRLRDKANLTRQQLQTLTRLRAAVLPLPPELYTTLLRHGEHLPILPPVPPPVPLPPDLPLPEDLRRRAQAVLTDVLDDLPAFTRDYARRAITDEQVTVNTMMLKMLTDAVRHAEQRLHARQAADVKRAAATRAQPPAAPRRPRTRLRASPEVFLTRWPEIRPFLPAAVGQGYFAQLDQGQATTLTDDDRERLNEALARADSQRQLRWATLAENVWATQAFTVPDGALLRFALRNRPKLVTAIDRGQTLPDSQERLVAAAAQVFCNPQPAKPLRTPGVFLQLMQVLCERDDIKLASTTLAKPVYEMSWLNALIDAFTAFLQGQRFSVQDSAAILRTFRPSKHVQHILLPRAIATEFRQRKSEVFAKLSRLTVTSVERGLARGNGLALTTYAELVQALGSKQAGVHGSGAVTDQPATPFSPQVTLHPLPPDLLNGLTVWREEIRAQLNPGSRRYLDEALDHGRPVPSGVIHLLGLTLRQVGRDRDWQTFAKELMHAATTSGRMDLSPVIRDVPTSSVWQELLHLEYRRHLSGQAISAAALDRVWSLLSEPELQQARYADRRRAMAIPGVARSPRQYLDALGQLARDLGHEELAERLLEPALEERWLLSLRVRWRQFREDGMLRVEDVWTAASRLAG